MLESVYKDTGKKMESSIDALKRQLSTVRTGRASLSILDGLIVDYYNTPTPLNHVAKMLVPDSRLITIQPFDSSLLGSIEKALLKADLGLNPTNDGKMIKLPIPLLTEERRKELVKVISRMGEDGKIAIRNVRREKNEDLKTMEKGKDISEDGRRRAQDKVQKITDEYIEVIEELTEKKTKEILEV